MSRLTKEEKIKRNKLKKEYIASIPEEIRVLFGKFYIFSIIYLIFFFIIYPFILFKHLNFINKIFVIGFLILFYIYMIIDVFRKKKNFNSGFLIVLIILVLLSMSFSIVKFWV